MQTQQGYGLRPTPFDARDFPIEKVLGAAAIGALPQEYIVSTPLVIKDQTDTDMCTAFALTAVSEDQEGLALDPSYTFFKTKQRTGDIDSWGADLRNACKSATKKYGGFLPMSRYGDTQRTFDQAERDRAARGEGFTKTDDWTAKKYAKQTYLSVKPIGDVFDGMRSAMWQTRSEERSVFTGIDWNPKWNRVDGGAIDADIGRGEPSFGHAIKIFGWSGEWMLAQLSNGKEIGDGGIFKLERGVVNEFCTYGAFTLLDLPREDAERALGKIGWFSYWLKSVFA